VLDLCTGSGCVACAIAHHLKTATVIATDVSPCAAAVARRNVERLELADRVTVEEGDLYAALNGIVDARPFDLIVSNPPYVPSAEIPKLDRNVREYEPISALDGGPDGLALHRRIMESAPDRLVPGGRIYLEIGYDQAQPATELAGQHEQFEDVRILKDYAGNDRVLTARRKTG
jgi:release factor glutamine methyltransferase